MKVIIKYAVLVLIVFTIIILAVLYFGKNDFGKIEAGKTENQNQTEKISEQYKIHFNFDGDQSQIIDLIKGEVELKLVYSGYSKFTAKLLHLDGTLLTMLADINGPYNKIQTVYISETGAYLLDVKTSGEWSLSRK